MVGLAEDGVNRTSESQFKGTTALWLSTLPRAPNLPPGQTWREDLAPAVRCCRQPHPENITALGVEGHMVGFVGMGG